MCSKRCGCAPQSIRQGVISASLIGVLAILAGCASDRSTAHSSATTAAPMQMAGAPVVIEGDDPREPWSPNYGSVRPMRTSATGTPNSAETVSAAATATSPARVIPASYSRPMDAEDIIRRAVAAHEMRQEN
jgi:hypothetical protein